MLREEEGCVERVSLVRRLSGSLARPTARQLTALLLRPSTPAQLVITAFAVLVALGTAALRCWCPWPRA